MKYNRYRYRSVLIVGACLFLMAGCAGKTNADKANIEESISNTAQTVQSTEAASVSEENETEHTETEHTETQNIEPETVEPVMMEADWSDYFGGLNGAAVFYEPGKNQYTVYQPQLANERRSPCSTFKIISSLIGLENRVIIPEDSIHRWSGEMFWNESWNQDIDFEEAFRTSCVWYYREVIDEIGAEAIQKELDRLQYGNCDISDWEGRLNNNNQNRALTGFWIESSLKISALEQVRVMERIFGADNTTYEPESIQQLKQVMLVTDFETTYPVYGKTGMGKSEGVVVDAWFTGFASIKEENLYFCIYLGRTDGEDVSSAKAKKIALEIISDYCVDGTF